MSRPKKEYPRTRRITIRVTELEYQTFLTEAEREKMTLAEYIRQRAIHNKTEVHYDINPINEDYKKLLIEHHKIGINLNQIAKHLNSGGTATPELIAELKEATHVILSEAKNPLVKPSTN